MTSAELDRRLDTARAHPHVAHLLLRGPSPTCQLCGGTNAPIIDGKHLNPDKWCQKEEA